MGTRGPIPKRESQRRRRNKPPSPTTRARAADAVRAPDADPEWHPAATQLYESLAESGQAEFYEPSDWATAALVAECMSRDLQPRYVGTTEDGEPVLAALPIKGSNLSAYFTAMTGLLATTGDRRRALVELERDRPATAHDGDNGPAVLLDEYRRRLQHPSP